MPTIQNPGVLLRSEPLTDVVLPEGQGWRIVYTTTLNDDTPARANTTVLPRSGPTTDWRTRSRGRGT